MPCTAFRGWSSAVLVCFALVHTERAAAAPAAVVVDDSSFYEHMPKGTILTQAGGRRPGVLPEGSWLFNNTALTMRSQAYPSTTVNIPEDGTYYLFVRSHGGEKSSFRVTVGDRQTSETFGNTPLQWKAGGKFELRRGKADVVLSRVVLGGPVGSTFDVLVLTTNPGFREDDLRAYELHPDVELVKEYTIPRASAVKFGDVDGDGKTDLFVLTGNYGGHMIAHDGRELWRYTNDTAGERLRAEFEAPGLVWDFDRDGRAEAVHYQLKEGQEWLVMSEGATGAVRHQVLWPTRPLPHVYNNFRLAVAKFGQQYPDVLLVFTDDGGSISVTAYTKELRQLWQHVEKKSKDHLGHYVYAVDLNGDGVDEVAVSGLVLDSSGKVVWSRFDLLDDNHDHCDSLRFYDLNGDGTLEILAPVSEIGVLVFRARDGSIVWRHPAEHTQQLEAGHFLGRVPGPHVAVNARTYARSGEAGLGAQVHWFDSKGNLLSKWPANPLNGNPDFVKGDWLGDGKDSLFWYRFRLNSDGKGELYFRQDVYHMFDFLGNGAEQVIARGAGVVQVYGYGKVKPKKAQRGYRYWQRVANHTHY